MEKIIYVIKKIFLKIYRIFCILFFNLFPIKSNKIFVTNYDGKGYGDNAKYIVEKLNTIENNIKIYWAINSNTNEFPSNVIKIKKDSIPYYYHLCTSKIWLNNQRFLTYIRKRKKQFYIQLWHGGIVLKKVEKDAESKLNKSYVRYAKRDSKYIDLFISNSEFSTNLYKKSFWYNKKILECGLPRNDILFNLDFQKVIRDKFNKKYNINSDIKLVLYAPTFRVDSDLSAYNIDYKILINNLKKKFKSNFIILLRLHPNIALMSKDLRYDKKNVIDVSNYDDMYELMSISDVLITDYSSCMFEFSIMKKPVFLYATDVKNYKNDRGFYFDYYSLPYSVSNNNSELGKNILNFSSYNYEKELKIFDKKINIKENGNASGIISNIIIDIMKGQYNEKHNK